MNKNIFRIVFNRARGLLMVAGELAKGVVKSASQLLRGTKAVGLQPRAVTIKPLVFALWLIAGLVQAPQTLAQIIPDNSVNPSLNVTNAADGRPQVNIQAPNQQGLSHNVYSQFNVNTQGAILNNSANDVLTPGTWVMGNPNLVNGTATVILNEVNSFNPSVLNGFIEVAGDRADVIVANPAGITCSGCGFINAQQSTLTTGRPQISNGNLMGYRVTQGQVTIGEGGFNAGGSDYTQIIARSIQVNGDVVANNLRVTAGANEVARDGQVLQTLAGEGEVPEFAIDVASLGGMYAGHIHLIGTEAGVGVRNAGEIGASVGEFRLNAEGQLVNTGRIVAEGNVEISSNDQVDNLGSGRIYGEDVIIQAETLNNRSEGDRAPVIAARNDMRLGVNHLTNEGVDTLIASVRNMTIGGVIDDQGEVSGRAEYVDNAFGNIEAGLNLSIDATTITNRAEGYEMVDGEQVTRPVEYTVNTDNGYDRYEGTETVIEREVQIINPGTLIAGGDITLNADLIDNENSRIVAGGELLTLG